MKTPLELATEHARFYVVLRGMWCEPLTWEEIRELLDVLDPGKCTCVEEAS